MTPKKTGWKVDLDPFLERVSAVATGSGSLSIFNAHIRLSLGLPADRKAASAVIGFYHPQRWKGRLLKTLVQLLIATNLRKILPGFQGEAGTAPQIRWLRRAAKEGTVGFLGCNPAHGPRCILGGILPEDGSKFVAKLGFDESAAAIEREAEFLNSIKGRYPGVISPVDYDEGKNWRSLRLPYLGEIGPASMQDPRIIQLLVLWISEQKVSLKDLPWAQRLLDRVPASAASPGWHQRMGAHSVHKALVHGDFAVWNLRIVGSKLCALDWEWAAEDGIAGIDLAHGLRQEYYMVKGMSPRKAVDKIIQCASNGAWHDYLEKSGWSANLTDWLTLGLLHSHFNARNNSAEMLEILGIRLPKETSNTAPL